MRILITGAGGMIGRKLTERLVRDGQLRGQEITHVNLFDIEPPKAPTDAPFQIDTWGGDIADTLECERLLQHRTDVVFHLAAIVSGEAELEFDKGWRVNFDGTRALFEAVRHSGGEHGVNTRVVFSSSIAVFGAPFPEKIPDDFFHTPLTSYGAQKSAGELMTSDYTRKGFFDGIGIRLPTICVRPGLPNKAASGFFSGIIREPLAGKPAVCPVDRDVMHWMASPRAAVEFLMHSAEIDGEQVGPRRNLTMPGIAVTVGEQVAALERVAGPDVAARVQFEPDPFIQKIVAGWPRQFDASRAESLGYRAEPDFDTIIRIHIEDEHGGTI